jgi:hypothetical protein
MAEPLRHRQTKGAETDMPSLPPPRHIPTLPASSLFFGVGHYPADEGAEPVDLPLRISAQSAQP